VRDARHAENPQPALEEAVKSDALGKLVFCLALIAGCRTVSADSYYASPGYRPYPPGCITLPANQVDLYGDNVVLFWAGTLLLEVVHKIQGPDGSENLAPVDVAMYRLGCAEPGRSVILVVFRLPADSLHLRDRQLVLPTFLGNTAMDPVVFVLTPEPNGWGEDLGQSLLMKRAFGDYSDGWFDAGWLTWTYILDIGPDGTWWSLPFLADYYNSGFAVTPFVNGEWSGHYIDVPSTAAALDPNRIPALPLNGRQSGTWIEPGAAAQGFLLAFGNPVPPAGNREASSERSDLVLFLTWYTFDAQGSQLWLAGNVQFPQGASEVVLPLVWVESGEFLGPEPQTGPGESPRQQVGELRVKSTGCNALMVDYTLEGLGLGAGHMELQRLEALETAGYPCRDYEARLASRATSSPR
jgi:hypothetical protein